MELRRVSLPGTGDRLASAGDSWLSSLCLAGSGCRTSCVDCVLLKRLARLDLLAAARLDDDPSNSGDDGLRAGESSCDGCDLDMTLLPFFKSWLAAADAWADVFRSELPRPSDSDGMPSVRSVREGGGGRSLFMFIKFEFRELLAPDRIDSASKLYWWGSPPSLSELCELEVTPLYIC
jgi:hypothetical protein